MNCRLSRHQLDAILPGPQGDDLADTAVPLNEAHLETLRREWIAAGVIAGIAEGNSGEPRRIGFTVGERPIDSVLRQLQAVIESACQILHRGPLEAGIANDSRFRRTERVSIRLSEMRDQECIQRTGERDD